MSQVKISGNASGTGVFEIAAPNSNTNQTLTLPDSTGTLVNTSATQTLTNKTLTSPNINSAPFATVSGTAPLYGCRAWVNFDGTTAGTFAGGTSTVTRIAGSTTATITTTTAHGMITGNYVYAATGVVAGSYAVTVLTSTTFTITTVATTALTAASITFTLVNIRGAGNINSVAQLGTGNFILNFSVAMPDTNYSVVTAGTQQANDSVSIKPTGSGGIALTTAAVNIQGYGRGDTYTATNGEFNMISIFR